MQKTGIILLFIGGLILMINLPGRANFRDTTIINASTSAAIEPDSQAIQKVTLAYTLINRNSDSAFLLAREVLEYSLKKNFYYGIGQSYNTIGWAFLSKGRYDSCQYNLLLAKQAFKTMRSHRDVARVNMNLSECYTRQSFFSLAIQSLLESQSEAKNVSDEVLLTDVNRQLGIIYRETGDNRKAIAYLKEGMKGFAKLKDDRRYINTAISLAIVYNDMDVQDSAIAVLEKTLSLAEAIPRNEYQIGMISEHLGNSWRDKEDPHRALQNYQRAYQNFKKIDNSADIAYEAMNIGNTYVTLKLFDQAASYYEESLSIVDSLSLTNYRFDLIRAMSKMYVAQGNWKMAYQFLDKSVTIGDSVIAAANLAETKEIKERYESEKQEREIALLKKTNEVHLLTLQKQRARQYAAVLLIVLSIVLGVIGINRYRVVQRSKRIIEIEKMRNDIASDLHDDIGSTLSSLNIQSQVLSKQVDGQPEVKQNLQKIHDHTLEMMESISDIVWAINPKQDTLASVIARMKEFTAEVLEPLNINYSFNQSGDFSRQINPRQRKNIYLIFKEAVNNAAKYARCSDVRIDLNSEPDWITIDMSDNGIGFDASIDHGGNGLKNMHRRAKELNGYLTIESTIGAGTTLRLNMPSHDLGMRNADLNSMLPSNHSFRQRWRQQ